MSNSPHPSRSRRLLAAGIYLLVAVVTFTGVFMVGPAMNGSGSQALPDAAAHLSALRLSTVHDELYAVAVALVCLVAVTLPRGRGFALTFVGAAIAVSANLFHGAVVPIQLIQADMAQAGLDPAQMVALYDRIDNDQWIGASLVPLMLLFPIGMITTALGLWRARLIPLWALGPAVLATLAEFLHVPHAEMLIPLLTPITSVLIAGALVLRRDGEQQHEVEHMRQPMPADARS
jgi:hypothetical protein